MNVVCQPYERLSQTISGGARMEPIAAPLLKIAMPKARSRMGNHSATVLAAPGQFPASPNPRTKRKTLRLGQTTGERVRHRGDGPEQDRTDKSSFGANPIIKLSR